MKTKTLLFSLAVLCEISSGDALSPASIFEDRISTFSNGIGLGEGSTNSVPIPWTCQANEWISIDSNLQIKEESFFEDSDVCYHLLTFDPKTVLAAARVRVLTADTEAKARTAFLFPLCVNTLPDSVVIERYGLVESMDGDPVLRRYDTNPSGQRVERLDFAGLFHANVVVSVEGPTNSLWIAEKILRVGGVDIPEEPPPGVGQIRDLAR